MNKFFQVLFLLLFFPVLVQAKIIDIDHEISYIVPMHEFKESERDNCFLMKSYLVDTTVSAIKVKTVLGYLEWCKE